MRILLAGNSARPAGGAEGMLVLTARLLRGAGHQVRVFTADGLPPPGGPEAARRFAAIWSRPAADALGNLVAGWRPDVAHVHHVYERLSLSTVDVLHRAGVPVVLTLHDYKPVCPNYRLFRDGRPCTLCLTGGRATNVVRHRCLEGPRVRGVAAAAEVGLAAARGTYDRVAAFVAPSAYLRGRVVAGGLRADRVVVLPNPVAPLPARPAPPEKPRFAYAGRLVDEKGLDVLLDAAALLPAGVGIDVHGDGRMASRLRARVAAERLPVVLHGRTGEVSAALHAATAAVLPALWPENCPLSLLEAAACAVPVVASAVGGIPELVADGRTGLLVPPGDPAALAAALSALAADPALSARLGGAARTRALSRHRPQDHAERLIDLLDSARTPARARARRT